MQIALGTLFGLGVIGASLAWYIKNDTDEARMAALAERSQLTRAATALADKEQQHALLKRNYDLQRKVYDSNQKVAELRSVIKDLEASIVEQQKAYQGIVESRRNKVRGEVIDHLVLTDGTEYRNARIMNFDDTYLSIQTEQGVTKVKARDLPEHLKEFFRLDLIQPEYSLAALPLPMSSPDTSTTASSQFAYTATPAWNSTAGYTSSSDKVKEFSDAILAVDKRITLLERAKTAPLAGFDGRLKVGSAAHKHRKKVRDQGFDNEIASLRARRKSLDQQRSQLRGTRYTNR